MGEIDDDIDTVVGDASVERWAGGGGTLDCVSKDKHAHDEMYRYGSLICLYFNPTVPLVQATELGWKLTTQQLQVLRGSTVGWVG